MLFGCTPVSNPNWYRAMVCPPLAGVIVALRPLDTFHVPWQCCAALSSRGVWCHARFAGASKVSHVPGRREKSRTQVNNTTRCGDLCSDTSVVATGAVSDQGFFDVVGS
eukprot:1991904-Amphidinium_carterae.1